MRIALVASMMAAGLGVGLAFEAVSPPASAAEAARAKNWTPPRSPILAQSLVDALMAEHPEYLSITLHGTPPGSPSDVFTMFAGSYPDRIGNPDDPDDIDVIKKGITIVDPRWGRTQDPVAKFVVQEPLRDRTGKNIGLLVVAYRLAATRQWTDSQYFDRAVSVRNSLAQKIPSFEALFQPA